VATPEPYVEVNAHLAQGDIYSLRLVAPLADNEVRILRTESGRHGDYAFSGEPSRIFDHDDLIRTLADLPPDERLLPFSRKGGIPLEYVVVFGDLVDFFMVASQTCDVSGVDGNAPKPFAAIVPVVSLAAYLSRERLPIGLENREDADESKWTTVADYVESALDEDLSEIRDDPFVLPERIRTLVKDWNPPQNSKEQRIRGAIRNVLNKVVDPKKKYIYYLPADQKRGVPESFVDFTRLYSVVTAKLNDLAGDRVCTLATPYREDFSGKLGLYLSRIATPAPLTPPKL